MRKFTRTKEDFVCINCSRLVFGNGYTNHCPNCLYSLHIDKYPGDRQELCRGIMVPVDIIFKGTNPHYIVYECKSCKILKKNITSTLDSTQAILKIIENRVKKEMMK